MRARRHAIVASVATGAALELVVGAIGGRREAWDSALYWSAGLPAALAAAAAIGYFADAGGGTGRASSCRARSRS